MLRALDDLDLADLRLDVAGAEPAIDDPEAPFLGLHDGHRGAGHGVHVGRDDRPLERQVLENRHDKSIAAGSRRGGRLLRRQQEIVECAAAHELQKVHGVPANFSTAGGHR